MPRSKTSKRFILIGIILLFMTGIVFAFVYSPIPKEAVFSGDHDGGDWIYLVEAKEGKYRFRIYRHWDETLLIDAYYKLDLCTENEKLTSTEITMSNWREMGYYFDESNGTLAISKETDTEDSRCLFRPQFPLLDGKGFDSIK